MPARKAPDTGGIRHLSDWDDAEVERAPICPECGVTALMADVFGADGAGYVCENPDCEQFGETIPSH